MADALERQDAFTRREVALLSRLIRFEYRSNAEKCEMAASEGLDDIVQFHLDRNRELSTISVKLSRNMS